MVFNGIPLVFSERKAPESLVRKRTNSSVPAPDDSMDGMLKRLTWNLKMNPGSLEIPMKNIEKH